MNTELHKKIAYRAFEIYEWRVENCVEGTAEEDWNEAKSDVLTELRGQNDVTYSGDSGLEV